MTEAQLRRIQEMEARMARASSPTPVEQSPPPIEQPKPRVPDVTIEAPVVQPVVEQPAQYFPPSNPPYHQSPDNTLTSIPLSHPITPVVQLVDDQSPPKRKRRNLLAWAIGLAILIVIGEVFWVLVS